MRSIVAVTVATALVTGCTSENDPTTDEPLTSISIDAAVPASVPQVPVATDPPLAPQSAVTTEGSETLMKDVVTRADDAVGDGVVPEGFSTVVANVTSADGEVCTVCLWLADGADERARGLMGVSDLGGPVGMVFVWDAPTNTRFIMFGTPTPLSIAWFDVGGQFVSETDMAPCLSTESARCDRYSADEPFVLAVEMLRGQLDEIGIGPGSTVELLADTESPNCATSPIG